jgi:hypothetical protein
MVSEANFQKKIIKYLESVDAYVFKHNASAISKAGVPDIICCYKGLFIGVEVKKDNKSKPTELQKYNLNKINKCGGVGIVLRPDKFELFKELIKGLEKVRIVREIGVE